MASKNKGKHTGKQESEDHFTKNYEIKFIINHLMGFFTLQQMKL